jgi:hypothetical protein
MLSSVIEADLDVEASRVSCTDDELIVELEDGRTISAPLAWYPRLKHGTAQERAHFEIGGFGIHWPDLDEDISVRGLLLGRKSEESGESLKFWLDQRRKGRKVTLEDFTKERRKSGSRKRKIA